MHTSVTPPSTPFMKQNCMPPVCIADLDRPETTISGLNARLPAMGHRQLYKTRIPKTEKRGMRPTSAPPREGPSPNGVHRQKRHSMRLIPRMPLQTNALHRQAASQSGNLSIPHNTPPHTKPDTAPTPPLTAVPATPTAVQSMPVPTMYAAEATHACQQAQQSLVACDDFGSGPSLSWVFADQCGCNRAFSGSGGRKLAMTLSLR